MARRRVLSKIQSSDPVLNRVQDAVIEAVNPLLGASLIERVDVPDAMDSTGVLGQFAVSSSHLFVVIAPNTWRRVALGTF